MSNTQSLTNHFLIAMPSLDDPNFQRTVTFICEHNDDGALGIVINRPSEITLGELLHHMDLSAGDAGTSSRAVYLGGPVQRERGFVLHTAPQRWESSLQVSDRIAVSTSRDILASIAAGDGPEEFLVALGYAGWGGGQLEEEMAQNAWLSGPADPAIIFHRPDDERWQAAASLLGVDLRLLSSDAGHA